MPDIDGIVNSRIELTALFEKRFPNIVLVLKGANTIIAEAGKQYISTEGCVSLAKAGSGDVLAGMICSLLAQGYSAGEAARSGVLAHGIASQQFGSSFGMTPLTLIEAILDVFFAERYNYTSKHQRRCEHSFSVVHIAFFVLKFFEKP